MNFIKKISIVLLSITAIASAILFFTGNEHIYKALSDTYLIGRTKPTINNPDLFHTRKLRSVNPLPWEKAPSYNLKKLSNKAISTHNQLGSKAFLVIHNDKLVHESYYDGYSQSSISNSFSMAKTILSVTIGIAVTEGEIDVNDAVYTYLPEYFTEKDSALKVKHLLNMTSGMNFDENYGNPFGFMAKAYYGSNIKELTKGYEIEKKPGTEHKYLGGNNLLLSFLLEKAVGEKVGTYSSRMLWEKLGMEYDAEWILDGENGDEKTFSGVFATARDFAKIGKLFMNKGAANKVQIIDSSYVRESLSPAGVLDETGNKTDYYGYAWWLTKYEGESIFYMRGILGQYVICVPSKNLIITRLGERRSEKKSRDGVVPDDVWVYLEEGLRLIQ